MANVTTATVIGIKIPSMGFEVSFSSLPEVGATELPVDQAKEMAYLLVSREKLATFQSTVDDDRYLVFRRLQQAEGGAVNGGKVVLLSVAREKRAVVRNRRFQQAGAAA